jgi:hypothetical protein
MHEMPRVVTVLELTWIGILFGAISVLYLAGFEHRACLRP